MIRFFRKYQKTVFGILIFVTAALVMTSFGVDFTARHGAGSQTEAAIQIDDTAITHQDFYNAKRDLEARYRQMLGPQFESLAKQFNLNIPQQVIDKLIAETLIQREASARSIAASDEKLLDIIKQEFPGGYDPSILRGTGKTPDQFLRETANSAMQAQYQELLQDASLSSKREARTLYTQKETQYEVQYAEFDPKKYLVEVKDPTTEELQKFFDEHKEDFQLPARVSYDYVAFSPSAFMDKIEVAPDEVEFYYTDNQSKFETPEQLKLRHIQLLFPKDTDPKKLAAVKEKAQEVFEKAKAGEDFQALVMKYSDDFTTRSSGGDLGYVPRGRYSKEFDEKTYKVKDGGLAELIETDYGFHVVKVEGFKASETKPLEAVRSEIETILKKEQAPAYADTKAREFFDAATSSDQSLAELAKKDGYTAASTNGLLSSSQDPEPALTGLTTKVLNNTVDLKQVIDLKDTSVVVFIKDPQEPSIPSLDTVKDKVITAYKTKESISLAQSKADEFIELVKKESTKDLQQLSKGTLATIQKKDALTQEKGFDGPLSSPSIKEDVLSTSVPFKSPSQVFKQAGKFYVVQVTNIKAPEAKVDDDKVLASRTENSHKLGELMVTSTIESLKSAAKITIDNSVLANES